VGVHNTRGEANKIGPTGFCAYHTLKHKAPLDLVHTRERVVRDVEEHQGVLDGHKLFGRRVFSQHDLCPPPAVRGGVTFLPTRAVASASTAVRRRALLLPCRCGREVVCSWLAECWVVPPSDGYLAPLEVA